MSEREERSILRGHPSYVWRFGQERRLNLVRRYVPLEGQRILDIGCGIGTYVRQFRRFTPEAFGVDIEGPRVAEAHRSGLDRVLVASGERLPFKKGTFDVVFLHEVIEHMGNDALALREAERLLRPGGHMVIYAPNRLYPFETHGFFLGQRYIFRLLPLINYFPRVVRRRFVPHARAYLWGDLQRLLRGLDVAPVVHSYVYPGFDSIAARRPQLASALRKILYFLERTPLRIFGLSHFVVLRKRPSGEEKVPWPAGAFGS